MDVFLYSGGIERGYDLDFVNFVAKHKNHDHLKLILCTPGGSPDAAYKMGRYIQSKYESIEVLVPSYCKSAGTLLAIAASELVFTPYGELGPLDIQMEKSDNLAALQSGLNISEALLTLEARSQHIFHNITTDIVSASGGIISYQTASQSARDIVSALYGPIFAKMDPEEVGSRARAMRIGEDYGKRLNQHFHNLKPDSLSTLSRTYSSHGFVIDLLEAKALFHHVREADELEKALVEKVGEKCRLPRSLVVENLTETFTNMVHQEKADERASRGKKGPSKGTAPEPRDAKPNGKNSAGTKGNPGPAAG